jgi:NAD-dependent dihydropyrimidine dehydrogenase PreA subunit
MKINENLCNGCGQCVLVCPVQAIQIINNKARLDNEKCVECNVCYRNARCPVKAIRTTRLKWPRLIRNPFSDVISTHKLTGVAGRGTEEMKTNDITNRFEFGELGVSIELGRPGLGTKLANVELFTLKLSKIGVTYEKASPLSALIIDEVGHIKEDVKNEYVLSAIIEFKIPHEKLNQILRIIKDIENVIDTTFTVGIISRVNDNGKIPIVKNLEDKGFFVRSNAKINIGLGYS